MADRERVSDRDAPQPEPSRGQGLESMVRFRSGHVASLLDPEPAATEADLLDEGGVWEKSGISRVPGEWQPDREQQSSELDDACREIERLSSALTQLRSERDQALWTALSVELDLGEQLESSRREAQEARLRAEKATRRQQAGEQKAKKRLIRFEQQIAELRERLTACEQLLGHLQAVGGPPDSP